MILVDIISSVMIVWGIRGQIITAVTLFTVI